MLHGKWSLWVVTAAVTALLAGGCCQEQDKQIQTLQRENIGLKEQNAGLRTELASAQQAANDATARLAARDAELRDKDQQINGLLVRLNQTSTRTTAGGGAAGWEHGTFGDRVVIGSDILFDSGKDVLKAGAAARLDQIVKDIKAHYPNMVIRVYGHTDKVKIKKSPWDDNLELSANRALTVTRHLISKGINAELIESVAMGEFHPESTTDMSKNRRVEIYAVKAK